MHLDPDILAAIIADPADDLPRLMMADWLDEHGQPERAEFIRLQIELANAMDMATAQRMAGFSHNANTVAYAVDAITKRKREDELLNNRRYLWLDGIIGDEWKICGLSGALVNFTRRLVVTQPFNFIFIRGFIGEMYCQAGDWLTFADTITSSAPIERVTLTTMPQIAVRYGPAIRLAHSRVNRAMNCPANSDNTEATHAVLSQYWPRIQFTLPRYPFYQQALGIAAEQINAGDVVSVGSDGRIVRDYTPAP